MSGKLTQKNRGRTRYISELPCYDSMETAQGATGIPKEAFKVAIREGAQIKHHGRIDLGEFLRWWFQRDSADGDESTIDWKRRGERANALIDEIKLMRAQDSVGDWGMMERFLGYLVGVLFFGEIDRIVVEFPGALVGKNEVEIMKECEFQRKKMKESLSKAIKSWVDNKGKT